MLEGQPKKAVFEDCIDENNNDYEDLGSPVMAHPDRTTLKVLAIEDEYHDYIALRRMLSTIRNYELDTELARSLDEAGERLKSENYDVIFIDYRLGPDSGIDVIKFLRQNGVSGAPILLTGVSGADVQREALVSGAIHCLSKSELTVDLLETTIRCALHLPYWREELRVCP